MSTGGQQIYKPSGAGSSPIDPQASIDGIVAFFRGESGTVVNLGDGRILPCLADLVAGFGKVKALSGASYTLAATDALSLLTISGGAPFSILLPSYVDVPDILVGFAVDVIQTGTGDVTLATESSDTLLSLSSDAASRKLFDHGAGATIRLMAQDPTTKVRSWALIGALKSSGSGPTVVELPT